MARQFGPAYADAADRAGVPFRWLCGPPGAGKSAVGYEIFMQVDRSGIRAGFLHVDQVGMCYPTQPTTRSTTA
jgi:adenylylsulfate kinase-like enzyme